MSRNRIKNSNALHWMSVVKLVLLGSLVSLLGLSYVFCKNRNLHLAEETRKLNLQLQAVEQHNDELDTQLERMKAPRELQRRLAEIGSSLEDLGQLQVVRLEQGAKIQVARFGAENSMDLNPSMVTTSPSTPSLTPLGNP